VIIGADRPVADNLNTRRINQMKSMWRHVLVPLAAVLISSSGALAQTTTSSTGSGSSITTDNIKFNHPPCDFNDAYYQGNPAAGTLPDGSPQQPGNGINAATLTAQGQRFGSATNGRLTGPPATGNQVNWVTDPTCSQNDPTRNNIRILATTGGYPDESLVFGEQQIKGQETEFISIIAFLFNQQDFFTGVANRRNIQMVDIVGQFEAYGHLKQRLNGRFFNQPCGTMAMTATAAGNPAPNDTAAPLTTNCFPVTSIATPQLRQDWRFATNRNALDGSDGNDPFGVLGGASPPGLPFGAAGTNSTPYGYFCDDLLGMWIVTYSWFTFDPNTVNPNSACGKQYAAVIKNNGRSLDGSPILKTGDDLNNTEAVTQDIGPGAGLPCAEEGQLDTGGADGGVVWIICPTIQDPRNGAIAPDAFLDQVKLPNGQPLDPAFNAVFNCLQTQGQFPTITGPGNSNGTILGTTTGPITHTTGSNGQPLTVQCGPGTGDL